MSAVSPRKVKRTFYQHYKKGSGVKYKGSCMHRIKISAARVGRSEFRWHDFLSHKLQPTRYPRTASFTIGTQRGACLLLAFQTITNFRKRSFWFLYLSQNQVIQSFQKLSIFPTWELFFETLGDTHAVITEGSFLLYHSCQNFPVLKYLISVSSLAAPTHTMMFKISTKRTKNNDINASGRRSHGSCLSGSQSL